MTDLPLAALSEHCFRLCATTRPLPGHARLLQGLRDLGGPDFAPRVSRGGWYRPGRILDAHGDCVAEDALPWLESAWDEADQDGERLAEILGGKGFQLTREQGVTHYMVSAHGPAPADFIQLEVEELQEVLSHPLGGEAQARVDSVESLIEHPHGLPAPRPLGAPRYSFRRVTDMAAQIDTISLQPGKPPPVLRFLSEWSVSSAGQHRRFCDHWVLGLSEHIDRFRQVRHAASPVAVQQHSWSGPDEHAGTELAAQLYEFDRNAGYCFAWYFQMISSRRVPRTLASRVHNDLQGEWAYLAERDAALVAAWVENPYSLV